MLGASHRRTPCGRCTALTSARCCVPVTPSGRASRSRRSAGVNAALARGNTLQQPTCVHRVGSPLRWLADERQAGTTILGVELADEAVRLADLPAARRRTVVVLGHESTGIPPEALDLLDGAVEIPMVGTGSSLNVAVAGSLVLYKLAGLLYRQPPAPLAADECVFKRTLSSKSVPR